ncbi:hypothetical protein BDV26DRAFT_134262 [Aspergillus bertholletiae]|uniref:Uncharacterized protein n=1 Tax=Aspergillus bertholletiae TaxID=1226010 RepID=A0A5N7AN66_9EURO|nr:hypothetical protein BDV26DRAFT_134262 [Aspergillus bertholletiae]
MPIKGFIRIVRNGCPAFAWSILRGLKRAGIMGNGAVRSVFQSPSIPILLSGQVRERHSHQVIFTCRRDHFCSLHHVCEAIHLIVLSSHRHSAEVPTCQRGPARERDLLGDYCPSSSSSFSAHRFMDYGVWNCNWQVRPAVSVRNDQCCY